MTDFRDPSGPYPDRERGYYARDPPRQWPRQGPGSGPGQAFYDPYSRTRDYYQHQHYMHQYQMHAYTQLQPHPMLNQAALDAFEKNWRYFLENPHQYEALRVSDRDRFDNLNRYYDMCGARLNLPPIRPVKEELMRPSSRASQRSFTASFSLQDSPPAVVQLGLAAREDGNEANFVHDEANVHGFKSYEESAHEYDQEHNYDYGHQDNYESMVESTPAEEPRGRMTPTMFCAPHVKGVFGAMGQFLKVDAKNPLEGQSATIEVHSMQAMLCESRDLKDLQVFPGPLVPGRTHKKEVIQFCQSKIQTAHSNNSIADKESYILVWELMILLLRQNNAIDGSDIAELLLKDQDVHSPYNQGAGSTDLENSSLSHADKRPGDFKAIGGNQGAITSATETEVTRKFRDYLLFGHKKEGLEYAMSHGLWGHALFLASKMDERSYSNVLLRFANGVALNDPLQTLYQLMSGRQPIAVKECTDSSWGDWRPHLAMILSNPSGKPDLDIHSILAMGDTLLENGQLYAAHFCYLMSAVEMGCYSNKSAKLVLIGADRKLPFDQFASNEAIQCTEVFEYIQKLSNPGFVLHNFQYCKFEYVLRLLDHGLCSSALYYLEQIAASMIKSPKDIVGDRLEVIEFVHQVLVLSEKLKFVDPSYTRRDGEMRDMPDPEWLLNLRTTLATIEAAVSDGLHAAGEHDLMQAKLEALNIGGDSESTNFSATDYVDGQYEGGHAVNEEDYQGQGYYEQTHSDAYNTVQAPIDDVNDVNGIQGSHLDSWQNEQKYPGDSESEQPIMMHSIPETDQQHHAPPLFFQPPSSTASSSAQVSPSKPPLQPLGMASGMPPVTNSFPPPTGSLQPNYFNPASTIPPPVQQQQQIPPPQQPKEISQQPGKNEAPAKGDGKGSNKVGLFGRILGRLIKPPNQVHLPPDADQSIVWDKDKKCWVDANANPEDEANAALAPPSDLDLSRNNSASDLAAGAAPVPNPADVLGNRFAAAKPGQRRGLQGRVDVFKNSQSMPALSAAGGLMPPSMTMPLAPMALPETADRTHNTNHLQPEPLQMMPAAHNVDHLQSEALQMMPAAYNVDHSFAAVGAGADYNQVTYDNNQVTYDNNQASYDNNNYYEQYSYADPQQQQQISQEPAPSAGGTPMFFNPAAFPAAQSSAATKQWGATYAS